jgi:hypothetical protein
VVRTAIDVIGSASIISDAWDRHLDVFKVIVDVGAWRSA